MPWFVPPSFSSAALIPSASASSDSPATLLINNENEKEKEKNRVKTKMVKTTFIDEVDGNVNQRDNKKSKNDETNTGVRW